MNIEMMPNIDGFPNYHVTSDGKVFNIITGRELKHQISSSGYLRVCLCNDYINKYISVHRLVALAYIPNLCNHKEVNHIDCDKYNNIISNLEWCSASYNKKHAFRSGRRTQVGANNSYSVFNNYDVYLIKKMLYNKFTSRYIASVFNVHPATISNIKNGYAWNHIITYF